MAAGNRKSSNKRKTQTKKERMAEMEKAQAFRVEVTLWIVVGSHCDDPQRYFHCEICAFLHFPPFLLFFLSVFFFYLMIYGFPQPLDTLLHTKLFLFYHIYTRMSPISFFNYF